MIDINDLTVRFGGVTPLDGVTLSFESGTCGLIGPNGAGKTTFFNVLSGFVQPTSGSIQADGDDLLALPSFRRARWGLRRTFQTEQAIEELTVAENVSVVLEHSGRGRSGAKRRATVAEALQLVGIEADADRRVGSLAAAPRRLVEVARAVVGRPRIILLDEPAAGLPDTETAHLAEVIRAIPEQTGALTIVVEHDMSLVSACCQTTAVLDFGQVIAVGPTEQTLAQPEVRTAYLGGEEQ